MANIKKRYKLICRVNLNNDPSTHKTIEIEASGKNSAERTAIGKLLNEGYFHACVLSCKEIL